MAKTAEKVFDLIKETVENEGVKLWDVSFVKEGASHYLRVFIDSDEGITIDDCQNVSHAIDPIIDEADPIDCSYYLEVCSPGIERELTRPKHFKASVGKTVKIKLYKAIDSKKEFIGKLLSADEDIVLLLDEKNLSFERKDISKATIYEEF